MPNVLYFCPRGVGTLLDKCPRGQKLRNVPIDINIFAIHGMEGIFICNTWKKPI